MHAEVVAVGAAAVVFCRKPSQTIVVEEGLEVRAYLRDQAIETQVELLSFEEIWEGLVLLHHVTTIARNILDFPC
jgi:hypothetical protein